MTPVESAILAIAARVTRRHGGAIIPSTAFSAISGGFQAAVQLAAYLPAELRTSDRVSIEAWEIVTDALATGISFADGQAGPGDIGGTFQPSQGDMNVVIARGRPVSGSQVLVITVFTTGVASNVALTFAGESSAYYSTC